MGFERTTFRVVLQYNWARTIIFVITGTEADIVEPLRDHDPGGSIDTELWLIRIELTAAWLLSALEALQASQGRLDYDAYRHKLCAIFNKLPRADQDT